MEEKPKPKPVFTQTELIGLEKTYNYMAEVKLKHLLKRRILIINKKEIKVNPRFWHAELIEG